MAAIDFEKVFADFINDNNNGNAIRDIYDIIPTLTQNQIKIINNLMYYADKYDLHLIKMQVEKFIKYTTQNKNLGFLSSMNMKNLLKAYTQEELVKGIKVQTNGVNKEQL